VEDRKRDVVSPAASIAVLLRVAGSSAVSFLSIVRNSLSLIAVEPTLTVFLPACNAESLLLEAPNAVSFLLTARAPSLPLFRALKRFLNACRLRSRHDPRFQQYLVTAVLAITTFAQKPLKPPSLPERLFPSRPLRLELSHLVTRPSTFFNNERFPRACSLSATLSVASHRSIDMQ
jgi:hypothetical protein